LSTLPQDSLTQLPHKMREAAGDFRSNWSQWRRDVRANPSILFQSLPVRLAFWLVVAVAFFFCVTRIMKALTPDASAGREAATSVATVYVACANPDCGKSQIANPRVDFKAWPMTCAACGKATVYRATVCKKCRNWIAMVPGQPPDCPHCRRAAAAKRPATKPARKESDDPDDREDGWGG
jgi:predicted RNA-binding Zn-ribbon protein involved in translation (DUF1610 family)